MASMTEASEWLAWMATVRRAAAGTIEQYTLTMQAFADYTPLAWQDVTPQTIEAFLLRPRRGGKQAAAATQQRERATIKSFYSYALRRGIVSNDPTFDVPIVKVANRNPKAIDDGDWQRLWSSPIVREDRVWLGLGAFAGLRRREIVCLAPSQIDCDRGILSGVARKGGALDVVEFGEMARIISNALPHVLPDAEAWIDDVRWLVGVREGDRSIVTHGDLLTERGRQAHSISDPELQSPKALNHALRRLLRAADMPPDAFTPHALRHTCATNLLRARVPIEVVADCLGHASTNMTMRYSKTAGRLAEWRELNQ